MKIIVPATSANIGPGFDSVGVAVTKYLQIEVCEERDEWLIEHQIGKWIPHDERNLLLKIALQIVPDLHPRRLKMTSDVPLARGLGSSSSVIVAGIELANQLGKLNLSDYEKLQLATKIEGHPDNVAPAIYGNLVIASSVDGQVSAIVADFPECDFWLTFLTMNCALETAVVSCLKNCPIRKLLLPVLSPMWRLRPCWQETW